MRSDVTRRAKRFTFACESKKAVLTASLPFTLCLNMKKSQLRKPSYIPPERCTVLFVSPIFHRVLELFVYRYLFPSDTFLARMVERKKASKISS